MRQQLPKEIDPFRFAHNGRELDGDIALKALSRLSQSLHSSDGNVEVEMRFDIDQTRTPYMQGRFKTTLALTCERCMEKVEYPIEIETQLGLIKHEKFAERLAEQYEPWIIDDKELVNPADVVEDELILALPLVPKHNFDCLPEEAWFSGSDEEEKEVVSEKPESPFAVLSALKSKK
ncbi:MAG TPA: DNA-binding protein [Methylophaga aminisulfidivorans]|uniref:Large ribosomal RNA subunit accumulation protein YceD n=2 Tax=root TaxID=1 RepID=A0A7C1W691_9GAMM|nr:DNA-binding protein [Methylophaga aminisulfidivorans]